MDKATGTRVYARRIVPFFVLFSVVDLRAALVFVSVRSGRVSSWQDVARTGRRVEVISNEKDYQPVAVLAISCYLGREGSSCGWTVWLCGVEGKEGR